MAAVPAHGICDNKQARTHRKCKITILKPYLLCPHVIFATIAVSAQENRGDLGLMLLHGGPGTKQGSPSQAISTAFLHGTDPPHTVGKACQHCLGLVLGAAAPARAVALPTCKSPGGLGLRWHCAVKRSSVARYRINQIIVQPTNPAFLGITTTTCDLSSATTVAPLKDDPANY
jgi:hypothetical protein